MILFFNVCGIKKNMKAYNKKINKNGSYRPFHGYTVVSMVKDHLFEIENFIKNSKIISKYFSPLPSSSYHMTVFNIWCHGQKLLPVQKDWLNNIEKMINKTTKEVEDYHLKFPKRPKPPKNKSFKIFKSEYINFAKGFESSFFINKDEFFPIMHNADFLCKTYTCEFKATISEKPIGKCVFTNQVNLDKETENKCNELRYNLSKIVGHNDENLVPHISFAYKYCDILEEDKESLCNEITELNKLIHLLTKNGINFSSPRATWFKSMTAYHTMEEMYK